MSRDDLPSDDHRIDPVAIRLLRGKWPSARSVISGKDSGRGLPILHGQRSGL
jgi:hypothetical protein